METTVITKKCLYNFDSFKPLFFIVKLGFTGVHAYIIFLISAQKHRLWVLVRTVSVRQIKTAYEAVLTSTHNLYFEQKYEKYQNFYQKFPIFGG